MNRYQRAESIKVHKILKQLIPELRRELENYYILDSTDSDISRICYKPIRRLLNKQHSQYKKEN